MRDLNDKVTGDTLTADEWNDVPSEIQNVITSTGISLSSLDLTQLLQSIVRLVNSGHFFVDSGSADAYVLTSSTRPITEYRTGMLITFISSNTNTGGSVTINVDGVGSADVHSKFGSTDDPLAGTINGLTTLIYDGSNFALFDKVANLENSEAIISENPSGTQRKILELRSDSRLYLGNENHNLELIGVDIDLNNSRHVNITPDMDVNINAGLDFQVQVNSNENAITATANAAVELFYNAVSSIRTSQTNVGLNISGGEVLDGGSTYRNIGFNVMPYVTSAVNLILNKTNSGFFIEYTGSGGNTFTIETPTNHPEGTTWVIANVGTGNLTISITSGTLRHLDGSGSTTAITGNRILAPSSVCTVCKNIHNSITAASNAYRIWGNGLS